MRKFCLILLFFLLSVDVNAQMITNRDSLKQVIAIAKEDTTKVNALWNLGFSYAFVHQDSAIMYASEGLELSKKAGYPSGEAYGWENTLLAFAIIVCVVLLLLQFMRTKVYTHQLEEIDFADHLLEEKIHLIKRPS